MLQTFKNSRITAGALLAASFFLASAPGFAASSDSGKSSPARAHATRCAWGIAQDGSNNCMSRAEFDITTSRQAALDADPAQYMRNALVRCEGLKGEDQQDCVARIKGAGVTSGSVEGGGIYRELRTIIPGKPAEPAPVIEPLASPAK